MDEKMYHYINKRWGKNLFKVTYNLIDFKLHFIKICFPYNLATYNSKEVPQPNQYYETFLGNTFLTTTWIK